MISYEPLWETMKQKKITTYHLITKCDFSPKTINNLKHNKSITMYTMEKLCNILDCTPNEIIRFIKD